MWCLEGDAIIFGNEFLIKEFCFFITQRGTPAERTEVFVDGVYHGGTYPYPLIILAGKEFAHVGGILERIHNSPSLSEAIQVN